MTKKYSLLFSLVVILSGPHISYAQDAKVDLNTYHTAPTGAYTKLRLIPRYPADPVNPKPSLGDLNAACTTDAGTGTFYILQNSATTITPRFCLKDSAGDQKWSTIPEPWEQNTTTFNINLKDTFKTNFVGIGTSSPLSKLHVEVTNAASNADVLIKAPAGRQASLTLNNTAYSGNLTLLSSGLTMQSPGNISFNTGGANPRLTLDNSSGFMGINDAAPDARLEIINTGTDCDPTPAVLPCPYLRISNSASGDRLNFFYGTKNPDGSESSDLAKIPQRVYINNPTIGASNPEARLLVKRTDDSGGSVGIGNKNDDDIHYDGGSEDGAAGVIAKFAHLGDSPALLEFQNNATTLLRLGYDSADDTGRLAVSKQLKIIGSYPVYSANYTPPSLAEELNMPADVELDVSSWKHKDDCYTCDPFIMITDKPGYTGLFSPGSDAGCPYLKQIDEDGDGEADDAGSIGVLTSFSYTEGGMTILGAAGPATVSTQAALVLKGVIGSTNAGRRPAVVIDGSKLDLNGNFTPFQAGDLLLRVNFWSSKGINFMKVMGDGKTGIGFNAGADPSHTLHIKDILRLEPMRSPPAIIDPDAGSEVCPLASNRRACNMGTIYIDRNALTNVNTLCYYGCSAASTCSWTPISPTAFLGGSCNNN